jgi:16S rRNA (adenine1518-N6/adenine1519-N6)-dimethyltransferase
MEWRLTGRRSGSTSTSSRSGVYPRAKKRFGQHFLADRRILDRIVDAADLSPGDVVVEVGPGRGALTEALVERGLHVVAVELDRDLIRGLRERFAATPDVRVVEGDVLARTPGSLLGEAQAAARYAVVANLPYNIAAAVLRHFLEAKRPPHRIVAMVQLEVARAVVAQPGEMSLLGVAVQVYADARLVMRVAPGAFSPPPAVQSAVVRLDVLPSPRARSPLDAFFTVVRAGFGNPRKQLRNSLATGLGIAPAEAEAVLRAAGVDPALRAQTLTIEQWDAVTLAWLSRSHP